MPLVALDAHLLGHAPAALRIRHAVPARPVLAQRLVALLVLGPQLGLLGWVQNVGHELDLLGKLIVVLRRRVQLLVHLAGDARGRAVRLLEHAVHLLERRQGSCCAGCSIRAFALPLAALLAAFLSVAVLPDLQKRAGPRRWAGNPRQRTISGRRPAPPERTWLERDRSCCAEQEQQQKRCNSQLRHALTVTILGLSFCQMEVFTFRVRATTSALAEL